MLYLEVGSLYPPCWYSGIPSNDLPFDLHMSTAYASGYRAAMGIPENAALAADPRRWVETITREYLWSKQREICAAMQTHRYVAVASAHDTGKSFIASRLGCHWLDTRPDPFLVTTAPTWKQVNSILWREMRKAHRKGKLKGRINLDAEWYINGDELVGFGRKPADYDQAAFQGIHALNVAVIIDEACHDDETEVLTEDGWKFFEELTGTERLLTRDPETQISEYVLPTRIVEKEYEGEMIYYKSRGANFCVTPDHEMYVQPQIRKLYENGARGLWRKETMEQVLETGGTRFMARTIEWTHPDTDSFTLPSFSGKLKHWPERVIPMDEWMEFLGWWCSEGSLARIKQGGRYSTVIISQKDESTLEEIYDLCVQLGFSPRFYPGSLGCVKIADSALADWLSRLGEGCLNKTIPDCVRMASARQINLFLDAYVRGDGYNKGSRDIIYTSSPRMAGALQEVILKTGVESVVRTRALSGEVNDFGTHLAVSSVDGFVVSRANQARQLKFRKENATRIEYSGYVYCATLPKHHLLLTRRDGYALWSGNCGVPKSIFEAADSLATNFRARVLAIGNPDDPSTYFAEICKPGSGWHFIEISAFDTPAFTDEEVPEYLYDLLVSPEWVEERKKRWGTQSPIYQSKVMGKFPEISDYTLFTPKIIRVSQMNDRSEEAKEDLGKLGVDVARFGDARTAIYRARGGRVRVVKTMHMADTMETANFVAMILRPFCGRVSANVDVIGVGGGVFDRLKEMRMTVQAFNSSESAWDSERFINRRAEAYWLAREMGERGELDLPEPGEDDDLIAQLGSIRWKVGNGGRIQIESKEDMKARGMPSPDRADAMIMALVQGANIKAFDIDESLDNTPTSGLRDRPM